MIESTEHKLDPDTFDLDAWIDGVKPLQQSVTLYSRGDLMPGIDDLVSKMQALPADAENDRTLGEPSKREQLREQLRAAWADYEASGIVVTLQQISSETLENISNEVRTAYPPPADQADTAETERVDMERNSALGMAILKRSVVDAGPTNGPRAPLRPEHVDKLSAKLPVPEFGRLIEAAQSLAFTGVVDTPFSQRVSAALDESDTD